MESRCLRPPALLAPEAEADDQWLALPGEWRGRASLALELDAKAADPRARRTRHRHRWAREVMDVLEPGRLRGSRRGQVLDPGVDRVADCYPMVQPIVQERDRRPLDPSDLTDQWSELCHRAAELAAEDGAELLGLLAARTLVNVETELPVAVRRLRLWDVHEENDRAILDGGSIDLTGVDVEGEHDVAEVLVGRPLKGRCGAGAGSLTGAVLEIGSAQLPAHRSSSLWPGPSSNVEPMPVNPPT